MTNLIPKPASILPAQGAFVLASATSIHIDSDSVDLRAIADAIAALLNAASGAAIAIHASVADAPAPAGSISLRLTNADPTLGDEGYTLTVTPQQVRLTAAAPAGLFYGVQTIRQLIATTVNRGAPGGAVSLAAGVIHDTPRFAWRGLMLDVARHFFGVADVKRVIDLMALYKLNHLHLHLTDDQGWRIMINSWPRLATYGGSTAVGGGAGGFYSQADYAEIIDYAQRHFITVVPEIDLPGHTNSALASYPELNRSEEAPPLYTQTAVGFSTLCTDMAITYKFLDDVIGELAALTPGPYIHIGGDEADATPLEEYLPFIERVQQIVRSHGKQVVGWEEVTHSRLTPGTLVQLWRSDLPKQAVAQGAKVILSPASRTYLDMKYDESWPLGLKWAGFVEVETAYDWEPATLVEGIGEHDIVGVEATIWSETLETIAQVESMLFPRLPGVAEVGWSPAESHDWREYRLRLAAHEGLLNALGVNFYQSPQVPWQKGADHA